MTPHRTKKGNKIMKIRKITYSLSAFLLLSTSLQATSLKEVLEHTMKSNQDIISKSLNNDAFKKYIENTGISTAFQIIYAEILTKNISEENVYSYTAMRLR